MSQFHAGRLRREQAFVQLLLQRVQRRVTRRQVGQHCLAFISKGIGFWEEHWQHGVLNVITLHRCNIGEHCDQLLRTLRAHVDAGTTKKCRSFGRSLGKGVKPRTELLQRLLHHLVVLRFELGWKEAPHRMLWAIRSHRAQLLC